MDVLKLCLRNLPVHGRDKGQSAATGENRSRGLLVEASSALSRRRRRDELKTREKTTAEDQSK
jgi:hypothetical protein